MATKMATNRTIQYYILINSQNRIPFRVLNICLKGMQITQQYVQDFCFVGEKTYMKRLKRYVMEVLKCMYYTKVLINTNSAVSPGRPCVTSVVDFDLQLKLFSSSLAKAGGFFLHLFFIHGYNKK